MGSQQNVPGSWGRTFGGSKFRIILINVGQMLVINVCGNVNSWIRVIHKIHGYWSPTNDEST